MAENDNPELTLQDAKSICARIAEVVRQRDELVEEVQALRQVLSELTAVRALLAETPGERVYARVATNGHIAPRGGDAAGEGAILL